MRYHAGKPIESVNYCLNLHFSPRPRVFRLFLVKGWVIRFYKFTVLLFAISTGPYIFTKVLRPLVRYWRLQAIRIVVYLDDGLGVCPTFPDCYSQSMAVKSDLSQLFVLIVKVLKAYRFQFSLSDGGAINGI